MENSIKKVIREYKSKSLLEENETITVDSKDREEITHASNPILSIMNKVESEVVDKYRPTIRTLRLNVNTKPVFSRVGHNNVERMNIKNGLLKIVSGFYSCGDKWFNTVKIPLSYFNMTAEEVKEAHKKWSENYLESEIKKSKKSLKERKIKQIEKLKKEIKELS